MRSGRPCFPRQWDRAGRVGLDFTNKRAFDSTNPPNAVLHQLGLTHWLGLHSSVPLQRVPQRVTARCCCQDAGCKAL